MGSGGRLHRSQQLALGELAILTSTAQFPVASRRLPRGQGQYPRRQPTHPAVLATIRDRPIIARLQPRARDPETRTLPLLGDREFLPALSRNAIRFSNARGFLTLLVPDHPRTAFSYSVQFASNRAPTGEREGYSYVSLRSFETSLSLVLILVTTSSGGRLPFVPTSICTMTLRPKPTVALPMSPN